MKIIYETNNGDQLDLETTLNFLSHQVHDLRQQIIELKKLENQEEQLKEKITKEMESLRQQISEIQKQQAEDHTSFWEGLRSLFKAKKTNIKTSEVDA